MKAKEFKKKKTVRDAFMPLAMNPDIQELVFL